MLAALTPAGCYNAAMTAILIIDDDERLAAMVADYLGAAGFRVVASATAFDGQQRLKREPFDALVLDLMLPDADGLEVCRRIRATSDVPILMLTARGDAMDRVVGLEMGADDYLPKPFAFAELVARISALARRAAGPRWAPVTDVPLAMRDDLVIESGGRTVALSPREYALFGCLLRRRGEVVARAEILRDAFGYEFDPGTNVIDVHLNHLRKKLHGFPVAIETVRGAGIRLTVSE
jgi:DNA-binding response OmpR family regulator